MLHHWLHALEEEEEEEEEDALGFAKPSAAGTRGRAGAGYMLLEVDDAAV